MNSLLLFFWKWGIRFLSIIHKLHCSLKFWTLIGRFRTAVTISVSAVYIISPSTTPRDKNRSCVIREVERPSHTLFRLQRWPFKLFSTSWLDSICEGFPVWEKYGRQKRQFERWKGYGNCRIMKQFLLSRERIMF